MRKWKKKKSKIIKTNIGFSTDNPVNFNINDRMAGPDCKGQKVPYIRLVRESFSQGLLRKSKKKLSSPKRVLYSPILKKEYREREMSIYQNPYWFYYLLCVSRRNNYVSQEI